MRLGTGVCGTNRVCFLRKIPRHGSHFDKISLDMGGVFKLKRKKVLFLCTNLSVYPRELQYIYDQKKLQCVIIFDSKKLLIISKKRQNFTFYI